MKQNHDQETESVIASELKKAGLDVGSIGSYARFSVVLKAVEMMISGVIFALLGSGAIGFQLFFWEFGGYCFMVFFLPAGIAQAYKGWLLLRTVRRVQ